MFERVALTAGYCTELKVQLKGEFGEFSNNRHQAKDASTDVRHLAYQIAQSQTVIKEATGRTSKFELVDIQSKGVGERLGQGVTKFNKSVVLRSWQGEANLDETSSTPIDVINKYTSGFDGYRDKEGSGDKEGYNDREAIDKRDDEQIINQF